MVITFLIIIHRVHYYDKIEIEYLFLLPCDKAFTPRIHSKVKTV